MALVEAGVAGADFEAGLAAAHAEVGRLEALLVAAKVRVNWYHRAIRRHARRELDAKHAPKKEETDVDDKGDVVAEVFAPPNAAEDAETEGEDKRSGALAGEKEGETAAKEEETEMEKGETEEEKSEESSAAAEEGAPPVAEVEAERAEDAGPTKVRKTKRIACPADQCKACWNTDRGMWPGVKHSRELRSCRLNKAEGVSHKRPRLVQRK